MLNFIEFCARRTRPRNPTNKLVIELFIEFILASHGRLPIVYEAVSSRRILARILFQKLIASRECGGKNRISRK